MPATQAHALQAHMYNHALAAGFSRGFIVSAAIMALALVIALIMIRVTREDLSGIDPMAAPTG
jgi:hypothetical protein